MCCQTEPHSRCRLAVSSGVTPLKKPVEGLEWPSQPSGAACGWRLASRAHTHTRSESFSIVWLMLVWENVTFNSSFVHTFTEACVVLIDCLMACFIEKRNTAATMSLHRLSIDPSINLNHITSQSAMLLRPIITNMAPLVLFTNKHSCIAPSLCCKIHFHVTARQC